MNKVFERRRNEFHAACNDIPVFQLGAVVFRHGFVAQGDGWDSNRSILARAICWRQGNGGTTTDDSGELDAWESHDACQSRRERECASECISTINVLDIWTSGHLGVRSVHAHAAAHSRVVP